MPQSIRCQILQENTINLVKVVSQSVGNTAFS